MWRTAGDGIIFAGAVAGGLAILWKFPVGPLLRRGWRTGVAELEERIDDRLTAQLAPIHHQLQADGGDTVKDLVILTHNRLNEMSRQLEDQGILKRVTDGDLTDNPV